MAEAAEQVDHVWARVQLARNQKRPHALQLLELMATDIVELHGDRLFGDDGAIVGGFCRLEGRAVVFVGQQKGADTDENIRRNFGSARPEGFRKAMRLFRLAEKLGLPVVTLVDTSGADPGPASEERGIAEAIARSIMTMAGLRTPIVSAIIGEGGSGGALGVAVADVVIALENAVYSVISPEGCAAILWRTGERAPQAAAAMRMTAGEQVALGVVDGVVSEPRGGAQRDAAETARRLRAAIIPHLDRLSALDTETLMEQRYARYREMGAFATVEPGAPTRPERLSLGDRLRSFFEVGRMTLGPPALPLRPQAADEPDEPPLMEEL
ncbi:MAG TPA: acetyl-CoA carboxylase carboxyltransferase subunit alpha [Candidatus Limnocylindrales bacterium]|nr:acetyl-CoA carboxylase carboxyltransferase subunit alpha [Candidatus Limnocylindrales bacterium]